MPTKTKNQKKEKVVREKENKNEELENDMHNDEHAEIYYNSCHGLSRKCRPCKAINSGKKYCDSHKHQEAYTDEDIKRMKVCSLCHRCEPISILYKNCKKRKKWCDICVATYQICAGKETTGNQCTHIVYEGNKYCNQNHSDMRNYTPEQEAKIAQCTNCSRYRCIEKTICILCIEEKEKKREIYCVGINKECKPCYYKITSGKTCDNHKYIDDEKYTTNMIKNLKVCDTCPIKDKKCKFFIDDVCDICTEKGKNKCLWPTNEDGQTCKLAKKIGFDFCKKHCANHKYTKEEIKNRRKCTGCRYIRVIKKGEDKCDWCINYRKIRNKTAREKRKNLPKCNKKNCNYSRNIDCGNFCGVHYVDYLKEEAYNMGMKRCYNVNRKCLSLLESDHWSIFCDYCLERNRIRDKERYWLNILERDEYRENDILYCECIKCHKFKESTEFTTNVGKDSYRCNDCREDLRGINAQRNIIDSWTNESRILNHYIRCHNRRNLKWELSDEEAIEIIKKPCYCCGKYYEKKNAFGVIYSLMGIDRVDNNGDYTRDNVQSACNTCNMLKYIHTIEDLFQYCKNIYDYFGSRNIRMLSHRSYKEYENDALKNFVSFNITEKEFNEILAYDCFFCDGNNGTKQVGIDKVNPNGGYCTKTNKLLSACKICNFMKNDHDICDFFNHILDILLFNKIINQKQYNEKYKVKKHSPLESLIYDIKKSYKDADLMNSDRRLNIKYTKSEDYYINNIWNSYDCRSIEPEIEFCETNEQKDIWLFYKNINGCCERISKNGLKILVRDKNSKKYLGLAELANITEMALSATDLQNYLKGHKDVIKENVKNIMKISLCIPLQPFGHNFCGGKLITKLMFSKEVYEYVCNKYKKNVYALLTYTSNGESAQYSGLHELQYIGKTAGTGIFKIKTDLAGKIKGFLKQWGINIKNKTYNITTFCKHVGIDTMAYSSERRGIYFGYTGNKGSEFLARRNNDNKEYESTLILKNITKITEEWYNCHVVDRFNDLCIRNGFKHEFDVDYNDYYVTDEGFLNKVHKDNIDDKIYGRYTRDEIDTIINIWANNRDKKFDELKKIIKNSGIKINKKYIKKLILGNSYDAVTEETKKIMEKKIVLMEKLHVDKNNNNKIFIDNKTIRTLCEAQISEMRKIYDYNDKTFNVDINNSQINFYNYFLQTEKMETNKMTFYNMDVTVDNVKKGFWKITKNHLPSDNDIINYILYESKYTMLEMFCAESEKDINDNNTITKSLYNEGHLLNYLAIYQTNANDKITLTLDNSEHIFPHKITERGNIFIKSLNNVNYVDVITYFNNKKEIIKIKLVGAMQYCDNDNINDGCTGNKDHCWCKFNGLYFRKKQICKNTINEPKIVSKNKNITNKKCTVDDSDDKNKEITNKEVTINDSDDKNKKITNDGSYEDASNNKDLENAKKTINNSKIIRKIKKNSNDESYIDDSDIPDIDDSYDYNNSEVSDYFDDSEVPDIDDSHMKDKKIICAQKTINNPKILRKIKKDVTDESNINQCDIKVKNKTNIQKTTNDTKIIRKLKKDVSDISDDNSDSECKITNENNNIDIKHKKTKKIIKKYK